MRYYTYISDAKVDVLLPQVPGALQQKVASKLGFDIKLLSGSISTERSTLDSRVARLQAVEAYLLEHETIGRPGDDAAWVGGYSDAKTVDLGGGGILFVAEGPSWVLGIGGSATHLTAAAGTRAEYVQLPFSFLPYLVERLTFLTEKRAEALVKLPEGTVSVSHKAQGFDTWADVIRFASRLAKGPSQRMEFLAKRLAHKVYNDLAVTLATPLYVALAE